MSNTILVLEDDFAINQLLSTQLKNEGYKVIQAFDGEEAIEVFNNQIDLALLDIMVPKKDGVAVLQHIRKISVIPVIFLTAKGEETDKLIALGLGADDYVTKPFSVMEVMYRVKAQLRRHFTYNKKEVVDHEELVHDDLRINLKTFTLLKAGRPVELSVKEFELLAYFIQHPGQVFTKHQLYEQVWGDTYYGDDNTIMVHISKLREKIGDTTKNSKYIKTIKGLGYRMEKL